MIYDGEMIKMAGNMAKPIIWKGYIGIIAGSTPSIYAHFEEVSDMGERFLYWRMRDFDPVKAIHIALTRKIDGKELDKKLSDLYAEYIKDLVLSNVDTDIDIEPETLERITEISIFAELVRTSSHLSYKTGEMDRLPVPAMPMRIAKQLLSIAKALTLMRGKSLNDLDIKIIDWFAYSLANEEKRAVLRILANMAWGDVLSTRKIADIIGLSTTITKTILQNLASVGVLKRTSIQQFSDFEEKETQLNWSFNEPKYHAIVRRIENIEIYSSTL